MLPRTVRHLLSRGAPCFTRSAPAFQQSSVLPRSFAKRPKKFAQQQYAPKPEVEVKVQPSLPFNQPPIASLLKDYPQLTISESLEKGRGLNATQSFAPHDVIFVEPALSLIWDPPGPPQSDTHIDGVPCFNCGRPTVAEVDEERMVVLCKIHPDDAEPLPCPQCHTAYCSPSCQQQSHSAHDLICTGNLGTKQLQALQALSAYCEAQGRYGMWALRLIAQLTAQPQLWFQIQHIMSRPVNQELLDKNYFDVEIDLTRMILPQPEAQKYLSRDNYAQLISILRMNGYGFITNEMKLQAEEGEEELTVNSVPGIALYPVASLINHSCRPNAVRAISSSAVTTHFAVEARTTIHPGDEITIDYVDARGISHKYAKTRLGRFLIRQRLLRQSYSCNCCCDKCEEDKRVLLSNELMEQDGEGWLFDDPKSKEELEDYIREYEKPRFVNTYDELTQKQNQASSEDTTA